MIKKIILLGVFTLVGCTSTENKPSSFDTSVLDQTLIGSVTSIEKSIRVLAETRNAIAIEAMSDEQKQALQTQVRAMPTGLEKPLTFAKYYGELEPIVRRVAMLTNYELIVDGKRKRDAVIVRTEAYARSAYDILRDLGAQAGIRAVVYVMENEPGSNSSSNGIIRIKYKGV